MRCQKDQCRSPVACGGFGYCRERNMDHGKTPPSPELVKEWQREDNSPRLYPQTNEELQQYWTQARAILIANSQARQGK